MVHAASGLALGHKGIHENMRNRNYRAETEIIIAVVVSFTIVCILATIGLSEMRASPAGITPFAPAPAPTTTPLATAAPSHNDLATTRTPAVLPPLDVTALPTPFAHGVDPTPIRVLVSTEKRSWVFYRGPATYVRSDVFAPLPLTSLPRPANDNGRGLHWFPTTFQTRAVVDRFVPELKAMRIRWVVILQGMNDWDLVANDYLVDQLTAAGMMPVMRIASEVGDVDLRRLGWLVAHYRERGVHYFQLFNEPNETSEWSANQLTPEWFAYYWALSAPVIAANGGRPGFPAVAPKGDDSDIAFFRAALEQLKRWNRYDLINGMWLAVHNYGGLEANGFYRYRRYDAAVRQVLGAASLPIIATEGGLESAEATASVIAAMYRAVEREREPYFLAFAPWLIGNFVGGGHDPRWEAAAWFTGSLAKPVPRPVVAQASQ